MPLSLEDKIDGLWETMTPEEQRRCARLLARQIDLTPDGHTLPPVINIEFVKTDGDGRDLSSTIALRRHQLAVLH